MKLTINGHIFEVLPNISSEFIKVYTADRWKRKKPIVVDHPLMEITKSDIQQTLTIMNHAIVDIQVDNLAIVGYLLNYFMAGKLIIKFYNHVSKYPEEYPGWIWYIYLLEYRKVCQRAFPPIKHITKGDIYQLSELEYDTIEVIPLCTELLNIHQLNLSKCRESNVIKTSENEESSRSFSYCKKSFKYCNYDQCMERFNEFTENLLSQLDWTNTVVAGGSVNLIVTGQKIFDYPASDIDIYFYGCDPYKRLNHVLDYLRERYDIVVFQRRCIITVLIRNHQRIVQLMNVNYNSIEDILRDFDLPVSQILYDGKEFLATSICIMSLISQTMEYIEPTIKLTRLVKYLSRGYSFILNNNCQIVGDNIYQPQHCDVNQLFKDDAAIRGLNKYFTVTDEPEERLLFLMRTIFSSQYQLVTENIENICDKNWKQYYDETPGKDIKEIHFQGSTHTCYLPNIRLNNITIKSINTFKGDEHISPVKYLDILIESEEHIGILKKMTYQIRDSKFFKRNNWCKRKDKCCIVLGRYNFGEDGTTSSSDSESNEIALCDIQHPGILRIKIRDKSVFQKKNCLLSFSRIHNYVKAQTLKVNIIVSPLFLPDTTSNVITIYLLLISLQVL